MAVSLNHVDLGPEEPARCTIKFKFSTYFSIKGLNSLNLCSFYYPRSILPVLDPAQCLQETLQLYLAQMWMVSTRLHWISVVRFPSVERTYETASAQASDTQHQQAFTVYPSNLIQLPRLLSKEYEERVLRIIVQAEFQPITELQDPGQLAKAFKEFFECCRWLHDDVKTIRRDISVGNLMFKQIGDTVYEILNDFDLAVQLNHEPRSTSKQRTGQSRTWQLTCLSRNLPIITIGTIWHHSYTSSSSSPAKSKVLRSQIGKNLAMESLSNLKHVAITKSGFPPTRDHFRQFRLWIVGLSDVFGVGFRHNNSV
ncbi:hypothetical protein DFH09DRAFT_1115447 [Mycena vulgaris]|nr:hypothetical protein DFH09DRAFT_1115447 [Mycena vulgaris]